MTTGSSRAPSWQSGTPGANPAENYERFFVPAIGEPFAMDLIALADLKPGEDVLDVACGTGLLARMAAEHVGREGTVIGLDIHPGMLEVARKSAPASVNIEWRESSAESMPFDDESFDVVLCQLGLQFMPDRAVALREMKRVLRHGGRLVLNVAGAIGRPFAVADELFGRHLGPDAAGFVRVVFSLHDPNELQSLLKEAGFEQSSARRERKSLHLPPPKEFLWQYIYSTPLAEAALHANDEQRMALERDIVERWKQFEEGDGMLYEQEIVLGTGLRK